LYSLQSNPTANVACGDSKGKRRVVLPKDEPHRVTKLVQRCSTVRQNHRGYHYRRLDSDYALLSLSAKTVCRFACFARLMWDLMLNMLLFAGNSTRKSADLTQGSCCAYAMSSGKLATLTSSLVIPRTTRKASLLERVKVIHPAGRQRVSTSRRARMRIYPKKARSPKKWETVCEQPFATSQHRRVEYQAAINPQHQYHLGKDSKDEC